MIFFFSGTGNSRHLAISLGKNLGERVLSIPEEPLPIAGRREYELAEGEVLGLVFPVYAWAPPRLVLDFVRSLSLRGKTPYVFSVASCGGEEGKATQALGKALAKAKLPLGSSFTIQMPNNYILGYDPDSPEEEKRALEAAETAIGEITKIVAQRRTGVSQLIEGKAGGFKTGFINPMFNRFSRSTKPFHATEACNGCGLCERICPLHTIKVDGRPTWGRACSQCLGCINRCPTQAIEYGKVTLGKGRYRHPDLR